MTRIRRASQVASNEATTPIRDAPRAVVRSGSRVPTHAAQQDDDYSDIRGVALETMRENTPRGKYVHHATDEWVITSNMTIESVLHCALVTKLLPGLIGTYIYPVDAVLHLRNAPSTRLTTVEELMQRERKHVLVGTEASTQQQCVVIEPPPCTDNTEESEVDDESEDDGGDSGIDDSELVHIDDDESETELPEMIDGG